MKSKLLFLALVFFGYNLSAQDVSFSYEVGMQNQGIIKEYSNADYTGTVTNTIMVSVIAKTRIIRNLGDSKYKIRFPKQGPFAQYLSKYHAKLKADELEILVSDENSFSGADLGSTR